MFPDLSVRIYGDHNDTDIHFELHTFDPDADDDGRARDYGHALIEGGFIVADLSTNEIARLGSLIENSVPMFELLKSIRDGRIGMPEIQRRAETLVNRIVGGEMIHTFQL
jgi:hypothetical protein